jgi:hypothetical protein
MPLKKKHKIYAAVVGLGLAALAVDRGVFGGGPDSSHASPGAAAPGAKSDTDAEGPAAQAAGSGGGAAPAPKPVTAADPRATAEIPSISALAGRLDDLVARQHWMLDDVSDAFVPPASWARKPQPATPVEPTVSTPAPKRLPPPVPLGERFVQEHHLTALMAGGGGGFAVVDGQTVRLGAVVEGFRLIDVRQRSTIWAQGAERVELTLEAATDAGGGGPFGKSRGKR